MKTTYVDPATGERHVLVRIASSAVALLEAQSADQNELLRLVLTNQAVIMRVLEVTLTLDGPLGTDLKQQREVTEARLAQPSAKDQIAA